MPLRLYVGVSRKVGLPWFSSVGASCQIELDLALDPAILESDLDGLHRKIRSAYVAAHQAVNDELARLGAATTTVQAPRSIDTAGPNLGGGADAPALPSRSPDPSGPRTARPATPGQARAIRSLVRTTGADLDGLLCDLDVSRPEDLTPGPAATNLLIR